MRPDNGIKLYVYLMEDDAAKYKLWLVGSRQKIESVLDVYPSMRENILEQQPYTGFDLVQCFYKEFPPARQNSSLAVR